MNDNSHRREDDELQQGVDAFRLLVESVRDYAIFMLTPEGRIASWNLGARRMKGYEKEEILGQHFSVFYTEEDLVARKPEMELEVAIREGRYREEGWRLRKDGSTFFADVTITALFDQDRRLRGFGKVTRDITERKRAEVHQRLLLDELNHRVKNTLATVQSITRQTLRPGISLDQFRETFEARLIGLSRTHNLLTGANWQGAALREIVMAELEPYRQVRPDGANVDVSGPDVYLRPKHALALGMALHELATNAAKHGALSNPAGRVVLDWSRRDRLLRLDWQESGGPPVEPPPQRGFGLRLLEKGLRHELGGETRLDFEPAGLRCSIEVSLPGEPKI